MGPCPNVGTDPGGLGAAEGEAASCVYHEDDFFGNLSVSSFRFGAAAA